MVRLVCFRFAGGGASVFHTWRPALPDTIELCTVQIPGIEDRHCEPTMTRVPDLADAMAAEIKLHLEKPFGFYGDSMGALLALETARRLRRAGARQPFALFAGAHRAPHLPPAFP